MSVSSLHVVSRPLFLSGLVDVGARKPLPNVPAAGKPAAKSGRAASKAASKAAAVKPVSAIGAAGKAGSGTATGKKRPVPAAQAAGAVPAKQPCVSRSAALAASVGPAATATPTALVAQAGHNPADAAAPAADGKAQRQRKKASDVAPEQAEAVVRQARACGSFAKVGLHELKAYLRAQGKPVGGKKAELVERVQALLQ